MSVEAVILADGAFPQHEIPLRYLRDAGIIVCCDGSTENLVKYGLQPAAIVGDMDSLGDDLAVKFSDRLFTDDSQESNDLTKAVNWCAARDYSDLVIVGATGKREDHTIGNISLLAEYAGFVNVMMITDTGILRPYTESSEIATFPGQQVSLFSIDPETEISSAGLKYPLRKTRIKNWWVATLNEAMESSFTLSFKEGRVIVYLKFGDR